MWLDSLRRMKANSGLTTAEIAERSGVPGPTLEKLFAGATKEPKLPTMSKLVHFFGYTLDDLEEGDQVNRNAPSGMERAVSGLSDQALELAKGFDALDQPGKRLMQVLLSEERKRVQEEQKARRSQRRQGVDADPDAPVKVIPLYFTPLAAGYASPAFGDDFEYIEVGGEVPAYADFAVRIEGDSMEPYLMDGSVAYVNKDPLANGDIGVFYCDGDMLCKQYARTEWGDVHLLSLNRARADADRYIPADSNLSLMCYGRVILPVMPDLVIPEDEL